MVAENYRGRRLSSFVHVQFLLLFISPSEVSVFPEAEGQMTPSDSDNPAGFGRQLLEEMVNALLSFLQM